MKETLICNAISIMISGAISFCIAKWVRPRAKVTVSLEPQLAMNSSVLGKELPICDMGNTAAKDIGIFSLIVETGFAMGLTEADICEGRKPAIVLEGLAVKNIRTVNNNCSRFNIPIARVSNDTKLILNINWIRRNTRAEFQVVGVLSKGVAASDVKAVLYPGLLKDVDVVPKGLIARRIDEHNFRTEESGRKIEIHS